MDFIIKPLEITTDNVGSQVCLVCPPYDDDCVMLYAPELRPIA